MPPPVWTVAVPLKPAGRRKSRLGAALDAAARDRIARRMAGHVLAVIAATGSARPMLLSRLRPDWWAGDWRDDDDVELNAAIGAARAACTTTGFAIVHADLPSLRVADVAALLAAAERDGVAIAPDRHRAGTNALAIADTRDFQFAFGPDSFDRHRAQGGTVVERAGLALDIDTPDDLRHARADGSFRSLID